MEGGNLQSYDKQSIGTKNNEVIHTPSSLCRFPLSIEAFGNLFQVMPCFSYRNVFGKLEFSYCFSLAHFVKYTDQRQRKDTQTETS